MKALYRKLIKDPFSFDAAYAFDVKESRKFIKKHLKGRIRTRLNKLLNKLEIE